MQRIARSPRRNHAELLEAQGLSFHARDQYWREDASYRFSLSEVEAIEAATAELHGMAVEAARHAIRTERLGQLQVPVGYWDAIAASLSSADFSLYGRMDLAYDGRSPPRLLEYNADTPTSALESAVCQWFWLKDCVPHGDQFNSLHEKLIDRWRSKRSRSARP